LPPGPCTGALASVLDSPEDVPDEVESLVSSLEPHPAATSGTAATAPTASQAAGFDPLSIEIPPPSGSVLYTG
jgi:hypothetical protein